MRSENRLGLTDREQRYVQNRLAGQNKTKAALNAGFSEAMAKKAGSKIEKAHVRETLQRLIQRYCHRVDSLRSLLMLWMRLSGCPLPLEKVRILRFFRTTVTLRKQCETSTT